MKTTTSRNFAVVLKELQDADVVVLKRAAFGLRLGLEAARATAMREYLSGPRPAKLDVRTRRLRDSIAIDVKEDPGRGGVVGRLGTNVVYGAFHEFGFKGEQRVREFTRVVSQHKSSGEVFEGRRRLKDGAGRFIGWKETKKRAARSQKDGFVGFQRVKAHTRKLNYKGRPFARPAIEKSLPVILAKVRASLTAAAT